MVTCGSYHTAAVTGNGDLYTWYGAVLEYIQLNYLDILGSIQVFIIV